MFTSRLPKSTSARRPSNPNDGSTSLFGTQIPVSVRKANLFTPQPKRSLQTGLSSTSRKSYINTDRKYQRTSKPVPDRDEQLRMFETLVDFLKKNAPGFPVPEAKRFFSSVSTTETSRLFEFLISQLIPDFKINKLEIDVPEALTHLSYPYIRSVTKSALVSITTRQAIVNLLVIFNWLIEFIERANSDEIDNQLSSPVKVNILNNPDATNEEMRQAMQNKANCYESACSELERVTEEYEQLMTRAQEIEQLVEERKLIEHDLKESDNYNERLTTWCKSLRADKLDTAKKDRIEKELKLRENLNEAENLLSYDELEAKQQALSTNIVKFNKMDETRKLDVKTKIQAWAVEKSNALSDLQKTENEFAWRRSESEGEATRLSNLRRAELNNYSHYEKKCAEVDTLNLEVLRNALDRDKQEAISLVRKAESERDRWNKLASAYKENTKVAKKVSKRMIV